MERHVLVRLKVATNLDFSDEKGNKHLNMPYFYKNSKGVIETRVYYFNENTDLKTFKRLYAKAQIYVFDNPTEVRASVNCIDWDLVENELEYELNQLQQIKKASA